jgi:hypothetical protein
MRLHRRSLTGLLLAMPFTAGGVRSASAQANQASDQTLAYYHQAKINWR